MGGRVGYYSFYADNDSAFPTFVSISIFVAIVIGIITTMMANAKNEGAFLPTLKDATIFFLRIIAPFFLLFWGDKIIANETQDPSIDSQMYFINDVTTHMNALNSSKPFFLFVGYSSYLQSLLLILLMIGVAIFYFKNENNA